MADTRQEPPTSPNDPKHIMALTVGTVLGFKVVASGLVRVLVRTPADRDLLTQTLTALFEDVDRQSQIMDAPFPEDIPGVREGIQIIRKEIFEELRRPPAPSPSRQGLLQRVLRRLGWRRGERLGPQ